MEWISVKYKKPKENQIVWAIEKNHQGPIMMEYAYINDGDNSGWIWARIYDVPTYHNGYWDFESEWDDNYEITHWMPLPEPPKQQ